MQKKLYRAPKDGIVAGVAAGIGHYFDKDPVIVRLIFVVLAFLTEFWPMLIIYVIMFFIVPVDPAQAKVESMQEPKDVTGERHEPSSAEPSESRSSAMNQETEEKGASDGYERMDSGQNV